MENSREMSPKIECMFYCSVFPFCSQFLLWFHSLYTLSSPQHAVTLKARICMSLGHWINIILPRSIHFPENFIFFTVERAEECQRGQGGLEGEEENQQNHPLTLKML